MKRIDPSGQHPDNDVRQLDDGIAEALVGWAKEHAAAGYATPTSPALVAGFAYYLRSFRLHRSEIASIEAAVSHRMPIFYDFEPRASS